jgi:hypothetical protein
MWQERDPIGTIVLVQDPALITVGLGFKGLACGSFSVGSESYNLAGTFDVHLQGALETVMFSNQHLAFDAVISADPPMGTCPMP